MRGPRRPRRRRTRRRALDRALSREDPVERWLAQLDAAERSERLAACNALIERAGDDPSIESRLQARLEGAGPAARFAAAFALYRIAPDLRLLAPLLEALGVADGDARWQAAQMLVGLGREHPAVLPALVDAAREGTPAMRRRMALFALRDLAPAREQTAAALLAALDDPDGDVRRAALACMGRLARPFPAAFRATLGAARAHADPRMRRIAVAVLPGLTRQLPDEAPRVCELLESLLESDDPSLARAAAGSLAQLAPGGDAR